MHDYLTQLVRRVQQPELLVQPRPLSLFESPRYSSESLGVYRTEEHELQVSPTARPRTTLDNWTDHTDGKDHDEFETAGVMPDVTLTEKMGQPYRRELVDSLDDTIEPDRLSWEMGKEVAAGKPAIESYEKVVRGERESIKPPVRKEQPSREPSFSSSPEPREFSAHAKRTSKAKHEPKQLPRELKSSAPRNVTEKQEPVIKSVRELEKPQVAMESLRGQETRITPFTRIAPVREEDSFDDVRTKTEKLESAIQCAREREEPQVVVERLGEREASLAPFSRMLPSPGEIFFDDKLLPLKVSSSGNPDARADVMPIPGRDKRTAFAEPVLSLHGGEQRAPSPTIQVSIGRIEVRATVASAPARKLQGKSSAMSLDEYLSRRREGRR